MITRISAGRLSAQDCPVQNRGSDRRSDGFTESTRGGWPERGSHGDALAPLEAPNSVYIVPEFFFTENADGQDVAHA